MKSFIESLRERFNALPIIEKIRAYLNAAEVMRAIPEARGRALQKVKALREEMKAQEVYEKQRRKFVSDDLSGLEFEEEPEEEAPGIGANVPSVRLGKDELYAGTAFGIPAVVHAPGPEAEIVAANEEFEMAKKIALWKRPGGDVTRSGALLKDDPDYVRARDAGDVEGMAKAADAFGRRK